MSAVDTELTGRQRAVAQEEMRLCTALSHGCCQHRLERGRPQLSSHAGGEQHFEWRRRIASYLTKEDGSIAKGKYANPGHPKQHMHERPTPRKLAEFLDEGSHQMWKLEYFRTIHKRTGT